MQNDILAVVWPGLENPFPAGSYLVQLNGVLLWFEGAQFCNWEGLVVVSKEELSSCSFLPCAEKAERALTEQCALFGTAAAVPSPPEGCASCVCHIGFISKLMVLCSWLPF